MSAEQIGALGALCWLFNAYISFRKHQWQGFVNELLIAALTMLCVLYQVESQAH